MAKDLLDKTGLTYLATKFQEWCEGLFVKKDTEYKDVYASDRGVKVSIGGTIGSPIISVETTVGEISENNSSVVSGDMVKAYVDANKGVNTVFKAQTSSSNAVNGLVPAPTSANTQKYLRGDGTWSTYGTATSTSNGLMSSEMASLIHPNLWSGAKGLGDNTHENLLYIYGKGPTCYFISDKKNYYGSALVYTMINDGNIGNYKVGSATVADKLGTSAVGSTKKPIYLNNGTATPIDYTIEKSVPSDAVFTDTHYTAKNIVSNSAGGIETAAAANGEVHINLVENDTCRSGIKIVGSGATQVVSDEWGNITITSDDTNTTYVAMKGATSSGAGTSGLVPAPSAQKHTSFLRGDGTWAIPTDTTYSAATQSASGLMSASDKKKLDGIANSANAYSLPNATSTTLGGVKIGSNITVNSGTISLTKSNVTSALGYTPPASDTNTTYEVVTSSVAGLAPKIGTAAASTIGTQSTEWVLASTSGGTPSWRKLPTNAFDNTTYSVATTSANGLMSSSWVSKMSRITVTPDGITAIGEYGTPTKSIYMFGTGFYYTPDNSKVYTVVHSGNIGSYAITGLTKTMVTNALGYTPPTTNTTYSLATTTSNGLMSSAQVTKVANAIQKGDNIDLSNGEALLFGKATSETWEYESGAGIKMLQSVGSAPKNAPSAYSVGLLVSGYYGFILARKVGLGAESLQYRGTSTNGWETVITDKNIESYTTSYAKTTDITEGNITAAKATTAASANAIGGKGLNDLVQGDGAIKFIKAVTSLPASPSNDTLYLIKQ